MSVFADGFPSNVRASTNGGIKGVDVHPELHSTETHLDTLSSTKYWEAICPGLHATQSSSSETNNSNRNSSNNANDTRDSDVTTDNNSNGNEVCNEAGVNRETSNNSNNVKETSNSSETSNNNNNSVTETRDSSETNKNNNNNETNKTSSSSMCDAVCVGVSIERKQQMKDSFVREGFFQVAREEVNESQPLWGDRIKALARGVEQLIAHGWPATFIYVFDEAWAVVDDMSALLGEATGGSLFLGDLYAWHVDPSNNESGWGPHRDRMGSDSRTFRPTDGTPMLSTSWLALTDANPSNSCLHVLPAYMDVDYAVGDAVGVDTLAKVFSDPNTFQSIRALPCNAGSMLHFGHRVIHWGSAARTNAPPRIAMSWVVGDSKFEQPAFPAKHNTPFPSLHLRVAFAAAQLIAYGGQTVNTSKSKTRSNTFYYRIYKRNHMLFNEWYQDKVEYLYHCRPPPAAATVVRRRKGKPVDPNAEVVAATKKDDELLGGMKDMFGSSSSESESEEE